MPTPPWPRSEQPVPSPQARGPECLLDNEGQWGSPQARTATPHHPPCAVLGAPGLTPRALLRMLCVLHAQGGAPAINDTGTCGSLTGRWWAGVCTPVVPGAVGTGTVPTSGWRGGSS